MANGAAPNTATTPVNTQKKRPPAKGSSSRSVSPTPIRGTALPRQNLINMFEVLRNNGQPMQTSEQGVPYKVFVGDPNEDPGYLRPPTQQDIDYGGRLDKAQAQRASGDWPMGINPVTLEQRITAAERQSHGPGWKEDFGDPLRKDQYGPSILQNMGDALKGAYGATLGNVVPFAYLPGGGIWKSQWGNRPNEALPMRRSYIERGHGTLADSHRGDGFGFKTYLHKYYGRPEPVRKPRPSNVYDELGMPQPTGHPPAMDVGQGNIPFYLTGGGRQAELNYGPAKVPPPGSEWGLPAGALALEGMALDPYLSKETRDLIRSGFPLESLPPKVQEYIKNTMEKPRKSYGFGGGGGGGGDEEEEEGEGRGGIFNILKILLGLLGLGPLFGGEKKKKKKKGDNRRPPARPQRIPWQTENRMNRQSYATQHGSARQGGQASGK